MEVMICLEIKSKNRSENKNVLPSLCPKCPNQWFVLYGGYVASRFFGGEMPLEIEILVRASLYDDELLERMSFELNRLRDYRGSRTFDHVRVYVKNKIIPENANQSFASNSTDGGINENDCFKVCVQSPEGKLTFKIIRVDDDISRETLRFDQDWDQAHFLRCPNCRKFSGLTKQGVIRRNAIGRSIPTCLYPVNPKYPTPPTKISDVLNNLGLNMACVYGLPSNFLTDYVRTKNSCLWAKTDKEWKTEKKLIEKWMNFYFEQNSNVFYTISQNLIYLDLEFVIKEEPILEVAVDLRIARKLVLLARLRSLLREKEDFNTLYYKLVGCVTCLFGKDLRFVDLHSNEYTNFEKMACYFLGDKQFELFDERLEDCRAGKPQGSRLNFMFAWIFDGTPIDAIQVG